MRSKPCMTLADCRAITAACEAEAARKDWRVAIAIVDDGGHLLMLSRMDDAPPVTAQIAGEKARSAAVSRRATKAQEDRIAAGRMALLSMPLLPVQGGVPIVVQGECVGAVGVSGAQSHEDELVCHAGIAAMATNNT